MPLTKKEYYMSRSKDGRELVYNSPAKLLAKAYDYFAWCDSNPLYKKEALKSGALAGTIMEVPIPRPYTVVGICVYCGISERTFNDYSTSTQFSDVVEHLKEIVKQNQLEGAAVSLYSNSVVTRLLEVVNNEVSEDVNSGLFTINVTSVEAKTAIEDLISKLQSE